MLTDLELGEGQYILRITQTVVLGYTQTEDGTWVPRYRTIVQRYKTRTRRDNAMVFGGWKFTLMNREVLPMYTVSSMEPDDSEVEL